MTVVCSSQGIDLDMQWKGNETIGESLRAHYFEVITRLAAL